MALTSANNKLNRGPCFWCIKAVKWVPVLFIVTIVLWSYYAYVVQLCLCKVYNPFKLTVVTCIFSNISVTIESVAKTVIYLIIYHVLFVMFSWSYCQTIFTDIGRVPTKVMKIIYFIIHVLRVNFF